MEKTKLENLIINNLENKTFDEIESLLNEYKSLYGENEFYFLACGDYYIFNYDYERVIHVLKEAIHKGIVSNEVFERIADAYYSLEQYENALEYINLCDLYNDDPNYIRLFELGAMCSFKINDFESAIKFYEDILMEDENHYMAYYFCGISYIRCGNRSRGEEYLLKSIDSNNETTVYAVLDFLSEYDDIELIEQVSKYLDEKNEFYKYYSFGYYYLNHKDFNNAIKNFKAYLRYENSYEGSVELAKLYIHSNDSQRGQDLLHDLYEEVPNLDDLEFYESNFVFLLDLLSYINLTKEEKFEITKKWILNFSYSLFMIEQLFEFSIENEMFDASSLIMEQFEQDLESSLHFQYLRVVYYIAIHKFKKALGYLLIMDNQETGKLYNKYMVVTLFFMDEFEKVIEVGKHLLPDGRIAMMLISCYNELGQYEEAIHVSEIMDSFENEEYDDKDMYLKFKETMEMDYD